MLPLAFLLSSSPAFSKLECQTPVVCDPSLESDIFIKSSHYADEIQCQTSCTIGHPNNPCKFFTWVPNAQAQVPNCYQMKACNEMADPITGSQSGAWSCEDPEIFCGAIGDIPAFDDKKTVWTCDHNVHPYGDASKTIFQDTTCRTTCPSFESTTQNTKADLVVSSTCIFDEVTSTSVWGAATPANVVDASGTTIESASTNPTPGCGCKDLVLPGIIADEPGKVFKCTNDDFVNAEGNTVITQDNDCALLCDGTLVFDLYCSVGQWSVDYLISAADIYCYGGGSTDSNGSVTLSTYWPPAPTGAPTDPPTAGPTEAPTDSPTTPADATTPAETTPEATTPAPADPTTEASTPAP